MAERNATDDLVDLAERAERLAQEIAELRRRIESRPKRRPGSSEMEAVTPEQASTEGLRTAPTKPTMPAVSDMPRGGDTPQWLPALKPDAMTRSGMRPPSAPPPSSSDAPTHPRVPASPAQPAQPAVPPPPPSSAPMSRSPASGVRSTNSDAGRYSFVSGGRGRRRDDV